MSATPLHLQHKLAQPPLPFINLEFFAFNQFPLCLSFRLVIGKGQEVACAAELGASTTELHSRSMTITDILVAARAFLGACMAARSKQLQGG